jgi:enterochelin esterase-like enzyme
MRANFRDDTAMKPAIRVHEVGSGSRTRLLVVLDGPEYQRQMRLLALLRRFVERGEVEPHRVALVVPEDRLESYSASARFARSLAETLAELKAKPVGVGSSLGGLALLHAHRLEPSSFAGLFLQSGSYFRRRSDPQESRFGRFGRVDRFVGTVLRGVGEPLPVPTTLTCALDEENYVNNAAVARALAEQGYPVEFHAARGGHDWPTWRRALELHLPALLRRAWK